MTRRRWIADTWTESTATLIGDQALHLARVLRAQPGAECDIVAGGRLFRSTVATVEEHEVSFDLITEIETGPALPVTLLLSVFKFDRMEWAIEKATELGVTRIVPVIARRTEKHLALASEKRVERWRRIAREAAQQSRRSDTPEIADAVVLKLALQQAAVAFTNQRSTETSAGGKQQMLSIVLSEQEQSVTLHHLVGEAMRGKSQALGESPAIELAFGPEGGWAPEELEMFKATGWKAATLGPRILRAETAAIAALSVVGALLM